MTPNIDSSGTTKTCPACAEKILQAAIRCKHCGEAFAAKAPSKKAIKLARWAVVMSMTAFGSCAIIIGKIVSTPPTDHNATLSLAEWTKHKNNIESLRMILLSSKSVRQTYSLAVEQKENVYIGECKYGGCSEYRGFLRDVISATADGIITPEENQEILVSSRLVNEAITTVSRQIAQREK